MYFDGYSIVNKDIAESVKWYLKAAERGDAEAQNRVGGLYSLGTGVRKDAIEATKWFRKAAEQGYADGQTMLGYSYDDGSGVRQNKITAKEWFGKGCDGGSQWGCDGYRRLNEAGY